MDWFDREWDHVVNVKRLRINREVAEVANPAVEDKNDPAVDGLKNNRLRFAGPA